MLQKVCLYLQYKARFDHSSDGIPEFPPMPPGVAMDVLAAADFLKG